MSSRAHQEENVLLLYNFPLITLSIHRAHGRQQTVSYTKCANENDVADKKQSRVYVTRTTSVRRASQTLLRLKLGTKLPSNKPLHDTKEQDSRTELPQRLPTAHLHTRYVQYTMYTAPASKADEHIRSLSPTRLHRYNRTTPLFSFQVKDTAESPCRCVPMTSQERRQREGATQTLHVFTARQFT